MIDATVTSDLVGKVALVTGAASGIGRAITTRFVADGASVIATDVDHDGVAMLAAQLGERVHAVGCDVRREDDVARAAEAAVSRFGRLDIGVANAGRGTYGMVVDHDLDEWNDIMALCVTGVFLTLKHAGRLMHDGGSLIVVSSLNAVQPSAGMSAYCTAKAGVAMLSRVAAMELGPRGIRVNTIAPGLVETNATAGMFQVPGVVEEFLDNAPLGRFAQPEEIADLAAYLACDRSRHMSAAFLSIDGGATTGRYPDLPAAFARMSG